MGEVDPVAAGRVAPMPALDGLRACAVLAVIGYHGGVSWLGGGYYGVDAFLVLSGFLITSLLVVEWDRSAGISLTAFWARRARRLFPALLLMLAGVALLVGMWPGSLSPTHLLGDTLAAIFYVANWHLAADHVNYFDAYQAQSPLLHTWTLAIEEQFYLVWPPVVLAVLARGWLGGRGRIPRLRRLLVVALVGAALSAAEMIWLAPPASGDPSRVYYGSDTRAQGLLVGAALAIVCALWGPVRSRSGRRWLGALGVVGGAGAVLMWDLVPETSPLAFHGGFMIISLSCAAVVAAGARVPASPVGRFLALRPLRYLGRISYGMYLWYWPILLCLTGARTGLRGYPLLGLRLAVVVVLASASYRWVETPIRRGALRSWRAALSAPGAAALVALAAALASSVAPVAVAAAAAPASYLTSSGAAPVKGPAVPVPPGATVPAAASSREVPAVPAGGSGPRVGGRGAPERQGSGAPGGGATPRPAPVGPQASRPVRILLVGDSMAGSLGVGLGQMAPEYGAQIVNQGMAGCSIAMDGQIKVLFFQLDPSRPCVVNDPGAVVAAMRSWVRQYDPDVVVYLARSEVLTQDLNGQWRHLGDPAFDAWVQSRFEALVPVLGSGGARVVLMTTPYYSTGEEANGSPWPEDNPARVVEDNSIIRSVAASSGATLVDLNAMVSPNGAYARALGGVQLRCTDGAHFTPAGGRWLASRILPRLVALGRSHAQLASSAARTTSLPPNTPPWYSKLPCAT